jgi:hypothetical protein
VYWKETLFFEIERVKSHDFKIRRDLIVKKYYLSTEVENKLQSISFLNQLMFFYLFTCATPFTFSEVGVNQQSNVKIGNKDSNHITKLKQ